MRHVRLTSKATMAAQAQPRHALPGLLVAQCLGAFNDNMYKIVLSLFAVHMANSAAARSTYVPLIGAIFILPFVLFSGYAGYVADVFSKRCVLIATKILEIVAMGLGLVAFLTGRIELMLGVLFLMALQSTFFSPAKYGILPEMLPNKDLARANGLVEMSTFLAIILGTAIGSVMFAAWQGHLGMIGLIFMAIAMVGTLASLRIPYVPASGAHKVFRVNPWAEIASGLQRLYGEKSLWLTSVGIAYFWFLGALLQMSLILLGKEGLGVGDLHVGLLQTFLAGGIGVGSLAAGHLSGDKVELALVPLGALGVGVCALLLAAFTPSYLHVALVLICLGFCGGLCIVPLNAFLQHKTGREEKGRVLATSNFLSTGGILLASGMLWVCRQLLHLQAEQIILFCGLSTLLGTVYVVRLLPDVLVRFLLWLLTHTVYRIRIVGQEHVPLRGPALLVCNHVSFVDGFLVAACVQRFIRFMVYRGYYDSPYLSWFFRLSHAIPVAGGNRKEVHTALDHARQALRQGHVVCIFAEGAISRTGNLLPFKRGFERIMEGLEVPVIPVHLDGVWGSVFSFKDGRFVWKWPRRLPYPVTVSFGSPLAPTTTADQARQAVMELSGEAVVYRHKGRDLLHVRFMTMAKRHWSRFCMADASGNQLTYGKALVGSLLLARWLRKQRAHEARVGLLLPASVGGALANIAVLLAGKIPVNLNFTAAPEAMNAAVQQCGIRTVLTSRLFVHKAQIGTFDGMVYLEEVRQQITPAQTVCTALTARLLPCRLLQGLYTPRGQTSETLATIVFSSGSTGTPKGVMLSHHNILANLEAVQQVFTLTPQDRMMGVLPLFHSFGFSLTLWLPLVTGGGVLYHPNPRDGKSIGEMVRTHKATMLLSTPTFCSLYLRQCPAEAFASLRYVIVGAEKLRPELAQAFKAKYGLDLLEGYGCTEMAPVVAVNVPDIVHGTQRQVGNKPGTVGHPIPGIAARVVHPDTGQPLPSGTEGLLLVKGPNRMVGYLGQPDKTAEVMRDGWYVTGDIAAIDADGFIRITDRMSRFSKIGGEMVPHIKVEDAINGILGDQACVVTAIPDPQKGERLVVLYTTTGVERDALWECVCRTDLPRLWLPRREHFYAIEALPVLGTGKVDLRQAKRLALEKTQTDEVRRKAHAVG
jgi:acyl-[acyl-carrier-protein]-phospholipid O-acyltransferase/long-chain-fatty-acid--[acyl-carrier-protein] ligase